MSCATFLNRWWVAHQRNGKDKLSAERRQRLDEVDGWMWSMRSSKHGRKKPEAVDPLSAAHLREP